MDVFSFVTGLFKPVTELVDEIFTSDEEKKNFKLKLAKVEKERAQKILDFQSEVLKQQASVIQGEVSGNWLQRSWRPIIMLTFGFVIFYQYFLAHVFGLQEIDMPTEFWTLLQIGVGGYLVGRSVEKVAPKIIDGSIKKKQTEVNSKVVAEEINKLKPEDLSARDLKKLARVKKREQRFLRGRKRRELRAKQNAG